MELREAGDGLPPVDCRGVVWRLDQRILGTRDPPRSDLASIGAGLPKRLKRVAAGISRLRAVQAKLETKLARFNEDQVAMEVEKGRLEEERSNIKQQRARLQEERARFDAEAKEAADHVSRTLRLPVRVAGATSVPADAFFTSVASEYAAAAPSLESVDEVELRHIRLTPEAAFLSSEEVFFGAQQADTGASEGNGDPGMENRIDSVVRSLLAVDCLLGERQDSPKVLQTLEKLSGLCQVLSRLANEQGRFPLAFASSTCAAWCAARLEEHVGKRLDEAQPAELMKELRASQTMGNKGHRRARQLAQHAISARRLLRIWAEQESHRRRFIRYMASKGAAVASDADLRLFLFPRDASLLELAAHIQRVRARAEQVPVPSRRKRPRLEEVRSPKSAGREAGTTEG